MDVENNQAVTIQQKSGRWLLFKRNNEEFAFVVFRMNTYCNNLKIMIEIAYLFI